MYDLRTFIPYRSNGTADPDGDADMNVENILKVADAIEQHSISDLGFNMDDWCMLDGAEHDKSGHNCGTVACVAGWAVAVARGADTEALLNIAERGDVFDDAADFLGLKEAQANALFIPRGVVFWDDITPTVAGRVLRHLASTDKVDWPAALVAKAGA